VCSLMMGGENRLLPGRRLGKGMDSGSTRQVTSARAYNDVSQSGPLLGMARSGRRAGGYGVGDGGEEAVQVPPLFFVFFGRLIF
jgi:hypothetical protein